MTEKKQTLVARLVIHGAAEMNKREAQRLARWLKGQATRIDIAPESLSKRYTARLWK